jgi:predicted CxxxxCH...CXXCH cytochrome family protein
VTGIWIWLLFIAALATNRQAVPPDAIVQQGAHRVHVVDTGTHPAYGCEVCHGANEREVTLAGWNTQAKSCNVYCHRAFNAETGPPIRWQASEHRFTCTACHGYPPLTGAHATHARQDTYSIACVACHGGRDWIRHHTAGSVYVALQARAGSSASYAEATCSNVACHSNGLGRFSRATWTDAPLTCASCHDDDTVAAPHMSGQHARHFRIGVACADCHIGVVDRTKHILDRSLHANGTADVKLLSGAYSAGACTPACHESRSW